MMQRPQLPWVLAALFAANTASAAQPPDEAAGSTQRLDTLEAAVTQEESTLDEIGKQLRNLIPGSHDILFPGNMRVGYTKFEGEIGQYDVLLRVHPYWRMGERMLAKVGAQFGYFPNNQTSVFLFFAEWMYLLTNNITLKAGMLLPPIGFYQEETLVEWVNKLTDEPLAMQDELIVPTSDIGVMVRGAFPLWGLARLIGAVSLTNGPQLIDTTPNLNQTPLSLTANHTHGIPPSPGGLLFGRVNDNNGEKSFSGRLALWFMPELEVGVSAMHARVGSDGTKFAKVAANIYDVDVAGYTIIDAIASELQLRAEGIVNMVDEADYGRGLHANVRWGYYVQLAIQPFLLKNDILRRFELVGRYDELHMPDEFPGLTNQQRATVGLLYWIWPSAVVKADYQWGFQTPVAINGRHGPQVTRYKVGAQLAVGF